jgi:hypothetical protein
MITKIFLIAQKKKGIDGLKNLKSHTIIYKSPTPTNPLMCHGILQPCQNTIALP